MVDRIKQVMDYAQMSPTAFADKIGVNRSSLTHIFSGRNQPSLDIAKKILVAFPEISTEWLIMGMGNMLQEVKTAPVATPEASAPASPYQQIDLFGDIESESASVETPTLNTPEPVVAEVVPSEAPPMPADPEPETTPVLNTDPPARPTVSSNTRGRGRNAESNNPPRESKRDRISNSQGDKKITKILFFYDDKSFDVYTPNNG